MDKNEEEARDTIRTEIYKAISEMLDHPDKIGIYPTTKCYDRLENYFFKALQEAERLGRAQVVLHSLNEGIRQGKKVGLLRGAEINKEIYERCEHETCSCLGGSIEAIRKEVEVRE